MTRGSLCITLVGLLALGGCATSLSVIHDPLYRAAPHTSTITASASNSSSGIQRIRVTVTTGEMTDCTELGGAASVIPCRRNATTLVHTCLYGGNPSTAACTYSHALGNQAIVTYQAEAQPAMGSAVSSEEVTYAGGVPPTPGILRPVWWHREQYMVSKINIVFFPDSDYVPFYTEFTTHMGNIVRGAFFNFGQAFASTYTLFRPSMNLWAAPFGADAEEG